MKLRLLPPAALAASFIAAALAVSACSVGGSGPAPTGSSEIAPVAHRSDPKGGADQPISELAAVTSKSLGTIVTDQNGFTLYRFDRDSAKPSKSNCVGACEKVRPPATVTGDRAAVSGIDPKLVGNITRDDGSRQLTLGGWPVYEFGKDVAQGDIRGQGVGGVWFAVTPTGAANLTPGSAR